MLDQAARVAHNVAMEQQRADPSDPFTYHRVHSHMTSGIGIETKENKDGTFSRIPCYSVGFSEETRHFTSRETGKRTAFKVAVPVNRKVM